MLPQMSFNTTVAGGEKPNPLIKNKPETPEEIEATINEIIKQAKHRIKEEILEFNISCVQNLLSSADKHITTGDCNKAIMDLATASRIDPTNANTRVKLAELTYVECPLSASAHLLSALHYVPDHAKANAILANTARSIGTTKEVLLQKVQEQLVKEQRRAEYEKRRCTTRPDASIIQACSTNY